MRSFTQKEVLELLGVKTNTLQGWIAAGLIIPSVDNPSGRGTTRLYSPADLVMIRVVMLLTGHSFNRITTKNLCDYLNGELSSGRDAERLDEKHPEIPGQLHFFHLKEFYLDPMKKDERHTYLILTDNRWEIVSGGSPRGDDFLMRLTINLTRVKKEIRDKIRG